MEDEEDDEDDEEVKIIIALPLLFLRSLIATSHSHLVPVGVHMPGFG